MYVKLTRGLERKLVTKCVEKAGSERSLENTLSIPKSCIYYYKNEKRNLPEKRFNDLLNFLGNRHKEFENGIISKLDKNWGRKKGGKSLIILKRKNGQFDSMLNKMHSVRSKQLKTWHKNMRRKDPENYYKTLYEKFKKIGGYKFKTMRGESVRNYLEKDVANFLFSKGVNYEYEPYLKIGRAVFFPDFKIKNIIIECTFWRGYDKAVKLKRKIKFYKKRNFRIFVVVPSSRTRYYKSIDKYVIEDVHKLPL